MLRKGDLLKWADPPGFIGIVLEDQTPHWPRILVYWLHDGKSSSEPIHWMTPLRQQKDA